MFKAVENLREQKGFTLIELLIVVAIIGILAAIAVPAFLGQREKAKMKQILASAKGSVTEIQSMLDSFIMQEAFMALDATGVEKCYQADGGGAVIPSGKDCLSMYPGMGVLHYNPNNVEDVIAATKTHHQGKGETSIFSNNDLFVDSTTGRAPGVVLLTNTTGSSIRIQAYAKSAAANAEIFDTTVTAR